MRHWHSRLIVASWSAHLPLVAWWASNSLSWLALEASGPAGRWVLLALAVLSVFALLDVILDDWLQLNVPGLRSYRHFGFMLIAICEAMIAAALGYILGDTPLLVAYLLPCGFSAFVAWLDLQTKYEESRTG